MTSDYRRDRAACACSRPSEEGTFMIRANCHIHGDAAPKRICTCPLGIFVPGDDASDCPEHGEYRELKKRDGRKG